MIVNYQKEGWQIITQRAHGMLAFQFARNWKHVRAHEREYELLLAVAEHDDAEVELHEDNLVTPQGGPVNFDMKPFDLDNGTRLWQLALTKSRYIALLTSYHLDFLYRKEASENKEASQFLEDQAAFRKPMLKELEISVKDIEADYRLLEWCDALSLLLCRDEIQPDNRAVEVSGGPQLKKYMLHQAEDKCLVVEPWPFKVDSFDTLVEYRLISQLQFKDAEDFREAFYRAPVAELCWKFKRS